MCLVVRAKEKANEVGGMGKRVLAARIVCRDFDLSDALTLDLANHTKSEVIVLCCG
jgi:hypothetical protein